MSRLDNRVAVVTGAARGLGEGAARALARQGAVVICTDVLDASSVAADLPASPDGRAAEAMQLDVSDTKQVEDVIAEIAEKYGSIDILANIAGVAQPIADLIDTSEEVIERVLGINVEGVIACSRAVGRLMRSQRHGRIINTASQVGKSAWPGWGIYCISKAAVISITQVLALELAPYNVTVNCICPGTMVTDMTHGGFSETAAQLGRDAEELLREKAESIPLGRMGTATDMGNMVAWIASEEASFTTGAAFNLTGGEAVFF